MRSLRVASLLALTACAALEIPPAETAYYTEQIALAKAVPTVPAGPEAAVLREAAAKLDVRAAAASDEIRRAGESEGLLDLATPQAREFLARLADPKTADSTLAAEPLDLEKVLLAVYARNPDVAAARANWAAAVRMYDQASYLEDLLLRYAAFTRLATPPVGATPMRDAAFPYPGLVALKGEMIDREVAMAREMVRMRLAAAMSAAAKAYHGATHHVQELAVREEEVALAKRAVEAARTRVASGSASQAELLEMETDLAMADDDRAHAVTNVARSRAELNTLLDRTPEAPLALHQHADPAPETPPLDELLALARRFSPEVRIARAEAARSAAAIRMSEAMLFAAPAPGAIAPSAGMGGAMAPAAASAPDVGSDAMGGAAMGGATPVVPALPPRDAPPAGAPGAFGPDVAWVAEMRERHAGLERAVDEAVRTAERNVIAARYEIDAARRMFDVAAKSTEPLSAQALEERMRLYEAGRGDFAGLAAAMKRHLDAAHAVIVARHEYGMAEAMLWMAAGARPEVVRGSVDGEMHK